MDVLSQVYSFSTGVANTRGSGLYSTSVCATQWDMAFQNQNEKEKRTNKFWAKIKLLHKWSTEVFFRLKNKVKK